MIPFWLNSAWMLKCGPERAAFAGACRSVAAAQTRLLRQILHANRRTWFGQHHHFDRVTGPRRYQQQVPLTVHEDFAGLIRRTGEGEKNLLTAEPVQRFEPTSGTSSGEKLIPSTTGLRRQFQRGVAAWIADLFHYRPAVRAGRAYWSLSPAVSVPAALLPLAFPSASMRMLPTWDDWNASPFAIS